MLIKRKSLIVVVLSTIVISTVLACTLIGYYMYLELKEREDERACSNSIKKLEAKIFSKYVDIKGLSYGIEPSGPLKGKPTIKGIIKNRSTRQLYNIILKVKFLDEDGASIYEVIFQPQEPVFGINQLGVMTKAYLTGPQKNMVLEANYSIAFKRTVPNCPKELLQASGSSKRAKSGPAPSKKIGRWSGRLTAEVISLSL